jgi:hypothetical protein
MGCHWADAEVIAGVPENEIKQLTADSLIARGFAVSFR